MERGAPEHCFLYVSAITEPCRYWIPACAGMTVLRVRTHRLHLASRRLLETDQPVAAIADALGFSTPSHFGELFHWHFGVTPKDYRRLGRAQPA